MTFSGCPATFTVYSGWAVTAGFGRPVSWTTAHTIRKHAWPGNLRELRNAVERGVIMCNDSAVRSDHLPPGLGARKSRVEVGGLVSLADLEAEHVRRVVAATPSLDEAAAVRAYDAGAKALHADADTLPYSWREIRAAAAAIRRLNERQMEAAKAAPRR